jgi:hypothetical protein
MRSSGAANLMRTRAGRGDASYVQKNRCWNDRNVGAFDDQRDAFLKRLDAAIRRAPEGDATQAGCLMRSSDARVSVTANLTA